MPISADDIAFLAGPFQRIEGWCHDESAYLATHLLRAQQAAGRTAPSFEIGVYKGKFLSVLHNASRDTVAFDTYEWIPVASVKESLRGAGVSPDDIQFIAGDSTKMTPAILSEHLGGRKAGFISVDGAHTAPAVFSDMTLVETALEPWGIVAIDDFLNPMAIGVNEGATRYLHTGALVPIVYCSNKLFVSRHEFADLYAAEALRFFEENQQLPKCKAMLEHKTQPGTHWAQQEMFGRLVWIVP